MKVAIDGPAGSGKSTVAHELARRCGLVLLDTGAMYRAVTLECHERGVDVHDADAVAGVAQEVRITFGTSDDGSQTVCLDGRDVTGAIRTPEVDADVSAVSAIPAVREAMVAEQRRLGGEGDVVAEGRDIGTVVFPDAEVKVFLTADPEARAHRRALQRDVHDEERERAILEDLRRRDEADSTREAAPLRAAEDAYLMDSSNMTVDEEVRRIQGLMAQARAKSPAGEAEELPSAGELAPASDAAPAEQSQQPVVEPTAPSEGKSSRIRSLWPSSKRDKDDKGSGRMHVFGDNTADDYYDHAIRDFPITSRALYGATILVCGALSKTLWPWHVENGEALWEAEGGHMLVMNHVSMIDPVLLAITDWMHGRRMRPIYKSEFDKHRIVKWFFARVGAIPVERGKADIKAVRRAQRALQRGEDVLVFPEGTRIYSDDQEVTIHGGFALMAQLAKAPVLPIAIVGARDGAPGGNKPLRPGRIHLRVGEPITFEELGVKGRKKQATAMEDAAMRRVYALRDALRSSHPGKM